MKNNVGKVFVVLTTFLSIAFLGFSFAARISGTNWEGEAEALEKYYVEKNVNEKETTYTVKDKINQESIKANAKLLPDVIVAAYNHEATQLNEKIQALEPLPDQLKKRQDEITAQQKVDLKALEAREQELQKVFEQLVKSLQDLSVEGDKVAQESLAVWKEEELRREDVARQRHRDEGHDRRHRHPEGLLTGDPGEPVRVLARADRLLQTQGHGGLPRGSVVAFQAVSMAPVMSPVTSSGELFDIALSATFSPRRITTMRSATAKTSGMR